MISRKSSIYNLALNRRIRNWVRLVAQQDLRLWTDGHKREIWQSAASSCNFTQLTRHVYCYRNDDVNNNPTINGEDFFLRVKLFSLSF